MPFVIGGLAAAGSVAGGLIGGKGAQSAASTQANAALKAQGIIQQTEAPYVAAGTNVLPTLNAGLTNLDLTKLPGYTFQQQQGQEAVQSANSARGLGVSGAQLKGAASYATGLAQSNFQTAWNDLYGMAQIGEQAAGASAGGQAAAVQNAGQATAAGQLGAANALSGAISGAGSNMLSASLISRLAPQTGTTGGYSLFGNLFGGGGSTANSSSGNFNPFAGSTMPAPAPGP